MKHQIQFKSFISDSEEAKEKNRIIQTETIRNFTNIYETTYHRL